MSANRCEFPEIPEMRLRVNEHFIQTTKKDDEMGHWHHSQPFVPIRNSVSSVWIALWRKHDVLKWQKVHSHFSILRTVHEFPRFFESSRKSSAVSISDDVHIPSKTNICLKSHEISYALKCLEIYDRNRKLQLEVSRYWGRLPLPCPAIETPSTEPV